MIAPALAFLVVAGSTVSMVRLFEGAYMWALAAHVAAGLCAGGLALWMRRGRRGWPWSEIAVALGTPCLGGPFVLMQLLGSRIGSCHDVVAQFKEYVSAEIRLGPSVSAGAAVSQSPDPGALYAVADILSSDAAEDVKRFAVEALGRLETPEAVDQLRDALTNPSVEARFYAASALARLEERLTSRLEALEREVESGHGNGAQELELAEACFDYAYYRVAMGDGRREYLERALDHAEKAIERDGDPAAELVAGRALLELGLCGEAEKRFSEYVERFPNSPKGLLWRAEARFRLGRYAGVREDCAAAVKNGPAPRRLQDAARFWGAGDREGTDET